MVNTTLLLLVQNDLEGLGAVLLGAGALADDLNGVDKVSEDVLVDSGQSAGTGALLVLVGARVDGALGAGQNAALSNEEDVAVKNFFSNSRVRLLRRKEMYMLAPLYFESRGRELSMLGDIHLTAAGSCGSSAGGERGRRQRWPSCRGRPRPDSESTC